MPFPSKYQPERIAAIEAYILTEGWPGGQSNQEIADYLATSPGYVSRMIRDLTKRGLLTGERPKVDRYADIRPELKAMRAKHTLDELATMYDIGAKTLRKLLEEEGVPRRRGIRNIRGAAKVSMERRERAERQPKIVPHNCTKKGQRYHDADPDPVAEVLRVPTFAERKPELLERFAPWIRARRSA